MPAIEEDQERDDPRTPRGPHRRRHRRQRHGRCDHLLRAPAGQRRDDPRRRVHPHVGGQGRESGRRRRSLRCTHELRRLRGRRPLPRPGRRRAHGSGRRPHAPAHGSRPDRHRAHPGRLLGAERHRDGAARQCRPQRRADRRGARSSRPHDLGAAHPARDAVGTHGAHHRARTRARDDGHPRPGTGRRARCGDLAEHRHRHPPTRQRRR